MSKKKDVLDVDVHLHLTTQSAVCAMARYYQLIIFTGMKYQYQAALPLPPSALLTQQMIRK